MHGWHLEVEMKRETLTLPGGRELSERWLGETSSYRTEMNGLDPETTELLSTLLNSCGTKGLSLQMEHTLLDGRRMEA